MLGVIILILKYSGFVYHILRKNRQLISRFIIFVITISYKMVPPGVLYSYKKTFSFVSIVTTYLAMRSHDCEDGVGEKVISQICNRSLKSSVFFIQ